ncbi:MAG: PilN domain-containing protein [Candidatus Goldbacteria bacterium]|nr:PilN domain-containing protein [Candidatus Goldiibacteriota bacterium]
MIEINLLPQKVKKQKALQAMYFLAGFIGVIIVSIMIGIIFYQQTRIAKVEAEIRKIDAESASLKDKIEEVRKFREKEELYNKKKLIVDKLLNEQSYWVYVLDNIGEMVLPDMWLESISQDKEKNEGIVIKTTGYSLSKIVVTEFIKRLETNKRIMDITTASIKETKESISTSSLIFFDISFLFKYTD